MTMTMTILNIVSPSKKCFISKENQAIKLSQLGTRGPTKLPFFLYSFPNQKCIVEFEQCNVLGSNSVTHKSPNNHLASDWLHICRYGLGSLVFLLIFLIPHIGTNWLNYILPLRNVDIVLRAFYLFPKYLAVVCVFPSCWQ